MTFDQAVLHILAAEGGYVNDPRDPGGETKFGISKRAYPTVNIASLTIADAKAIYKKDYWDKVNADSLRPPLDLYVFDAAVNQGVSYALKTLEQIKSSALLDMPEAYLAARLARYKTNKNFGLYGRGWTGRLEALRRLGNGRL